MSGPLLQRSIPLLRRLHHYHHHLPLKLRFLISRRTFCSAVAEDNSSPSLKDTPPQHPPIWDNTWKEQEALIIQDLEPITTLAKQIIHSNRYMDGEHLTEEDEKIVKYKILAHHPHSEDKIGCGLDSIMVDRHPQFKTTRCLFVVRTDGEVVDFSYRKCLRAYIRDKFPSHAKRFIEEHHTFENCTLHMLKG